MAVPAENFTRKKLPAVCFVQTRPGAFYSYLFSLSYPLSTGFI